MSQMKSYQVFSSNIDNSHAFTSVSEVNNANGLLGMIADTEIPCSYAAIDYEDGPFDGPSSKGPKSNVKTDKKEDEKKRIKEHRYAFQTRSRVDVLDDGYRWRKYGQKSVKDNKFPRSYYRCTEKRCNVKKQVQRLAKDAEIVVTTYEGTHNHHIIHKSGSYSLEHNLSCPTPT